MHSWQAIEAMMALAHETRLAVFRILVNAGPEGLPAGTISTRLRVTPSTLSHHLAVLERADLLVSRRLQRQIFYACAYDGIRGVVEFLTNDCCQGHPDLCGFTGKPARPVDSAKMKAKKKTPSRSAKGKRGGMPGFAAAGR